MLLGVSLVNKKLLSKVFNFFITHQCVSFDLQKIYNSFFPFIFFLILLGHRDYFPVV